MKAAEHFSPKTASLLKGLFSAVEDLSEAVTLRVSSHFKDSENVPFDLLDTAPPEEPFELPNAKRGTIVTYKFKKETPSEIIYRTHWTNGSCLDWHYHADCTESIESTEGKFLVEIEDKGVIEKHYLGAGEKIFFGADLKHRVTCLSASGGDILVTFNRV